MIRSYKVAFVALFVGLLALTVFAVSVNTYRHATRVSLDLSADILSEMSAKVVAETSARFEAARDLVEINALLVGERGLEDDQGLFRLFGRQLALLPQIESLYVAGPNGDFIQARSSPQWMTRLIRREAAPGEDASQATERLVYRDAQFAPIARINGDATYDPRQRDWYRQAVAAERLQWSPVYRFAGTGERGLTAAVAVREPNGSLIGVVGVDISLNSLSQFLSGQRIARGGIALIVDADRQLIAFPESIELRQGAVAARANADATTVDTASTGVTPTADAGLPRVDDLGVPWLVDAYRQDAASQQRSAINRAEYSLSRTDGRRYLAQRQAFPPGVGDDWELMLVAPEITLLESARRLFSEAAAISLILLLAAAIAVSFLALRLFQPLKRLVLNTELIREFRFADVKRVPSRFAEIKAMDEALWKMSQGLRSLEKFVPIDVGRRLIQSGKRAEPEAEVRELTLLFTGASDLASLCEALPPARITELLGRQLDIFTNTILRHKGTIDNFLGESVLAFWGAPVVLEDSVDRACRAVLACRDAETALHADWAKSLAPGEPAPPLNLFSVHHGRAIVGAIGSRQRMSWTAIGDNVALGWDLHQLNRRYGTRIIISGEAREHVAERYWTRRLDVLPLNSGARKLEVFELIDRRDRMLPPERLEAIARYEAGLEALLEADWERAEAIFQPLADRDPTDFAVALMLSRCGTRDACFWPGLAGPGDDMLSGPFVSRPVASPGLSLDSEDQSQRFGLRKDR
ncbi:adenylate/guanylate cyclase domain-containing protein [Halochromatium roseum]|uniref:adenylate/guanylate cyclase domain-containing protein n=1 Tax=Halochromatium roseum TaxID=391920 RepID=UPI0019139DA8|nr:adenylate/guanylate cyclase domain-containing protein [Halochromatium roseum]